MINRKDDPRKAMKVPEGFFERFEEDFIADIETSSARPNLKIIRGALSVAAALLAVLTIAFVMKGNLESETEEFADVSLDDQWEYLIQNAEELTYEDLFSFEESEEALDALENEIYSSLSSDELLEDLDLEMIENLYE